MSNLLAGAFLVGIGAILTVTGIGAFIGVPVGLLGLAVMFPNLAKVMVVLAVIAFIALLFML